MKKLFYIFVLTITFLNSNLFAQFWVKKIGGINSGAFSSSITIDLSGNIYIIGTYFGTVDFDPGSGVQSLTSVGQFNVFFAKYDASGNYLFAKGIGGTNASVNNSSITVDVSRNIYISGSFGGVVDFDPSSTVQNLTSASEIDVFFAKYDANGNYIFAKRIGGTNAVVINGSIALDRIGNIYLSGFFGGVVDFDPGSEVRTQTSIGEGDTFFAKYDSNGIYIFTKSIGGTNSAILMNSMAIDVSGNLYIAGMFFGTVDFNPSSAVQNLTSAGSMDVFFAKYDVNGNYLFANGIGGATAKVQNSSITKDINGNIYVSGIFTGTADFDPSSTTQNLTSAGLMDVFFAKYDVSGNYIFAKGIGGTSAKMDKSSIAIDATGNFLVSGMLQGKADFDPGSEVKSQTSIGEGDTYFAKYDASGNYIFANMIGGANALVSTLSFEYLFFGEQASPYISDPLAIDGSGNIYISGFFMGEADFDPSTAVFKLTAVGKYDLFFAKYSSSGTLKVKLKDNKEVPAQFELSQNYPNPFNPATTIRFGLPSESNVKLEVYNSLGQLVQVLIDERLGAYYYEVKWEAGKIPSGLYFYKITTTDINNPTNTFTKTMKMVLMK